MEDALIPGLVASFLAPLALGMALVDAAVPRVPRGVAGLVLRAALAAGVGLGVVSVTFFAWGLAFGLQLLPLFAFETVIAGALTWWLRRRRPRIDDASGAAAPAWLRVALAATLLAAVIAFVVTVAASPHGDNDALGIWNLRARFLLRAWGDWSTVFNGDFLVHTDYPLLVPLLVTRAWIYAGSEAALAPPVLGGVFTFATVGVLFGTLVSLRGGAQATVAALALLGTPYLIYQGAQQTADLPLAFFMLTALAALAMRGADDGAGLARLAGFAAGAAAWTKNEGILFALLLLVAHALFRRGTVRALLAGALLPLLVLLAFKLWFAGDNDLLARDTGELLRHVTDGERYRAYGIAFLSRLTLLTEEGRVPGCSYAILLGYGLLVGRDHGFAVPRLAAGVLASMVLGYFMVFVALSPSDIAWHTRTAVARLLLQLWPATLCVVFAFLNRPLAAHHA